MVPVVQEGGNHRCYKSDRKKGKGEREEEKLSGEM